MLSRASRRLRFLSFVLSLQFVSPFVEGTTSSRTTTKRQNNNLYSHDPDGIIHRRLLELAREEKYPVQGWGGYIAGKILLLPTGRWSSIDPSTKESRECRRLSESILRSCFDRGNFLLFACP